MSLYVCPLCGSKFLKLKAKGSNCVFTVGPEYSVTFCDGANASLGIEIGSACVIHCGACSWYGEVYDLQESSLDW